MNNQGWIKLHRKLKETSFYKRSVVIHLFIHLLLSANQLKKRFYWNGQEVEIEAGQLITGRDELSKDTGISPQSIRTALTILKSTSTITIKSTNRFSLITIPKWSEYQGSSTSKSTSKLTNNQPTTNQQLTTNNNIENEKNNKKEENSPSYLKEIPEKDLIVFSKTYFCNRSQIINKGESLALWLVKKGRAYKNYRAALQDCLLRDFGKRTITKEIFIPKGVEVIQNG